MSIYKNFPSASDLGLDMWMSAGETAGAVGFARRINTGDEPVADVYGKTRPDQEVAARRIEMIGDLYETLRELAERARLAGLDVEQATRVLGEVVSPKPYGEPGHDA